MYTIIKKKTHSELYIQYKNEVKICLVDTQDIPRIKKHSWCVWSKFNKWGTYYYIAAKIYQSKKQTTVYLHQFLLGKKKNMVIDHINQKTLDNRTINLRFATRRENLLNSDKITAKSLQRSKL